MYIGVYGSASTDIDKKYIGVVKDYCKTLAERGHHLLYGAGKEGMMGAAALGFKEGHGRIAGVTPTFFEAFDVEELYEECDNMIYTDNMATRKAIIEQNADAFLILPGGIGTLDEFFEVLTLKQLHQLNKPIALFNVFGYYYPIESLLARAAKEKFLRSDCLSLYQSFTENELDKLTEYLEAPCPPLTDFVETKYGLFGGAHGE